MIDFLVRCGGKGYAGEAGKRGSGACAWRKSGQMPGSAINPNDRVITPCQLREFRGDHASIISNLKPHNGLAGSRSYRILGTDIRETFTPPVPLQPQIACSSEIPLPRVGALLPLPKVPLSRSSTRYSPVCPSKGNLRTSWLNNATVWTRPAR
ncbi:hypothetical protein OG21DRAFT_268491 [Imleria badia]|nr:hypothetical protein OG21DRAFT_268491 [Imleria badia]